MAITALRTALPYSSDANPDCSKLSKIMDDSMLPLNVARLHVVGGPSGPGVSYRWSMKKSAKGLLAADLDIGPGGEKPAISGMCSEFGNACLLTQNNLNFYNEDHILWVAPTCDVLPEDTRKAFRGGVSRVQVKVKQGGRKVGVGSVDLAWGHNGSVTLFVSDMERPPRFQDGMPRPFPVAVFANPIFAFNVNLPNPPPAGTMTTDFGGAGKARGIGCPLAQFSGCDELDFPAAGRFIVLLTLKFDDGSALCDNITVRVAECSGAGRVEVIPKPKRPLYDPANASQRDVDLTVRLLNISKPRGGLPACPFLLRGGNVLSCSAALKVGGVTDTKTTTFDLQHCSATTSQGCQSDADCACPECQLNEICLTRPHCSKTFTRACGNDLDCQPPACIEPDCKADETCVRILSVGVSDIFVPPGQSVELFHQPLTLTNLLADTARLADTWTANVLIPPLTASGTLKYRIRGRPNVAPP